MIRSIVAIVAGFMVASAVIGAGEFVRNRWYSPVKGYTTSEELEMHIERARRRLPLARYLLSEGRYQDAYLLVERVVCDLPISQFVAVFLFFVVGTVPGAWFAASLARRAHMLHGLMVGALVLTAAFAITFLVPRLLWYWLPGEVMLLPAAYAGARLGARSQAFRSRNVPSV
ncbi:MAG TPA: hypothetical protein VKI17_09560 [Gemmataceae bacterium]|nr:hypothetical protein [Gemmataceae bacterium]